MRITRLRIEDFRSFAGAHEFALGNVNVFIGPNNAGKSSILRALHTLQDGQQHGKDVRVGATTSRIQMEMRDIHAPSPWPNVEHENGSLHIRLTNGGAINMELHGADGMIHAGLGRFTPRDPQHFIVPYLSGRKTALYQENINVEQATAIQADFSNLAAKLSRLGNPSYPAHQRYAQTCREILGFTVTAVPSANGQRPGIYLPSRETLGLEQMGDGVPNIVGLLADLAQSDGKLFLIEEPENDLHPHALKALLELIIESSQSNQIVVSTHSNIVARYLGAAPESKLYYVSPISGSMPPESVVSAVSPQPEARLKVLRELGYEFSDFDLWEGWLILEESSAERIIRDYLIRWFAPKLSRVRTFAAGGNTKVAPAFEDFNRLILFTNLDEAYKNSAWVLLDGDEEGHEIVEDLRSRFSKWKPDRFDFFDKANFERYYPEEFAEKVEAVLSIEDRQEKRNAKRALLEEVVAWLDEDDGRAQDALRLSAATVIAHLQRIEQDLFSREQ